jgi:23S rRNA (uracil1939-C5)-methyltransferase
VLDRVSEIKVNELSAQSLQGLELGLAALSPADRAKICVVRGAAGAARLAAVGAQVVIADPPRKGLDPELLEYLSEQPPDQFVYVSCGLESFLGDVARLTSPRKLRLVALSAFNLSPFTLHVETVARFERT